MMQLAYKYLDEYFLISEKEFIIEVHDNITTLQKPDLNMDILPITSMSWEVHNLAIVLHAKKTFYENPQNIIYYLKNNLQFMRIKTYLYPGKLDNLFEIVRLEIMFYSTYNFNIKFWFQNIEDTSECYTYNMEFPFRKREDILNKALAWRSRQLESKK